MADTKKPLDLSEFGGAKPLDLTEFQTEPPKPAGALRKAKDLALGFASGAVGATKALADAVAPGGAASGVIGRANEAIQSGLSDETLADQKRQQDIINEANGKGVWEGVKAGARAFAEAPVQTAVTGLGSVVPTVAAAALTRGASIPVSLAAMGGMGGAQGVGGVRGGIYDDVYQRSIQAGQTPEQAQAAANEAAKVQGPNAGNMVVGGVLGAADALTGVSKAAAALLRPGQAIRTASGHGAIRRMVQGAAEEAPLEFAQGAQQQYATNVGAGNAGFAVDPMDGVIAQGTLEGLASAGPGAALGLANPGTPAGALPPPTVAPTTPPAAPAAPPGTPAAPTDQVGANLTPSVGAIPNGEVLPLMPAAQAPEVDYSRPAVTRARAMGINPDRGPLSAAAAIAVNNGATDVVQRQQLEADAAEELKNTPKPAGAVRKSAEAPKKKAEPPPPPPIERTGGPLSAAVFSLPSTTTGASDAPDPEAQQGATAAQPGAATDPAAAGGTGGPAQVAAGAAPDEAVAGAAAAQGRTDLTGGATNAQDQGQAGGQEAGPQPAASAPGAPEPGQPAAGPELLPQAQEQQQPDAPATVDLPAHATAATSPTNDIPQPTEAQKQAGNYPKGHVKLGGLDLSIENPEGSTRSGKDASGKPWETRLRDHYGYIRGTIGNDKDHVDTFVKPGTPLDYSGKVFVVDQVDPATGKFDEHKVMIGFDNPWQARLAYMRNYAKGWKGMQAITPMEWADFKTWVFDGPKNKALAAVAETKAPAAETTPPAAGTSAAQPETKPAGQQAIASADGKASPGAALAQLGESLSGFRGHDKVLVRVDGVLKSGTVELASAKEVTVKMEDGSVGTFPADEVFAAEAPGPTEQDQEDRSTGPAAATTATEVEVLPAPDSPKPRFKAGDTVLHNTARAGEPDRWVRTTVAKDATIVNGQPVYWVNNPEQRGAQRPAPASHVAAVGEKPETAGDVKVDEKPATADEKKDAQWQKRDALRRSFEAMADEVRAKGHTLLADHLRYLSMRASDPSGGVSPHWHFLMRMRLPKLIEQAEKDPTYPFHEYIPPGSKTDLKKANKARDEAAKKEANTTAARKAKQAEIFTALVSDPASVGQDEAAITQRVKDGLGLTELTDAQVQKLAASVVKEVAKRAVELEKQKHRIPAVREAAIAAAITERYKADDLTTEQHSAFIAGFDHALAGKTKSTLAGDYLDHRQAGYAAASKWIKTEEGAAWYEGRAVNKLENTGVDLRRWWEKLRENMKADESDIAKAWAQIERATARADLFAPLLAKPNMTPGHTLYITEFRSNVRPFKDWLQEQHDRWYGESKSRWDDSDKSNIDYILEGGRYPYSLSEKDREKWETDSAYRATWLRAAADKYLTEVRSLISFFDGTNTLKEAIDAFTAKFTDPAKSMKFLEQPSERGQAATTLKDEYQSIASNWRGGPFWLESVNVFAKFRSHTPWTDKLLLDQNAESLLPTTAKPLTPPKLDRVTRDGADVRAGKDVTPAEVKARFGLADVGFGKWVGAKQDQDHLNYAHDAFMDLAKFLGIKPKAIGLNGMHFTIGALGHGKFAAHFHPAQPHPDGGHVQVINVTNTRGDGTVAHEWFHALDHNLGGDWKNSVRPQFLAFLKHKPLTVERVEAEARKFLVGGWFWQGDKRLPKPEAAMRALRRYSAGVVNDSTTAYKNNADALGKDYWGNNEELIARASEAYVGDKLGFKNTYLVNPGWSGDGAVTKEKGYRGTPYPTGEERAFFNEIFDALIKSIKWEGGKPTVSRKDFEANLPEVIKAGEVRRQALLDHAAMIELHESFLREQQERIDEIERERAEAKRAKQAELDRLAQEKIDQMKPPKEPEAPPPAVVDGPNEPPAGALSDADLEHLFDQAAAELQEAQQETPDRPVPDEAPAATAAAWTQADLDEMMAAQDKAGAAGIATAEKIEGLPTIHELGAMGKTTFLGDGFFETTGYGPAPDVRTLGKPWRMTWSGGGAMRSTSSGKSYTLVQMSEGARPFTMSVQKAMEAVGSLKAPATTPQPVGESDLVRRARERLEAGKPAPLDAGIVRTADNKRAEASATALIAEATKLGVKGASEALTGLAKLFGGSPGRLNSFGAGFDEETYQKAKPHFKEALAAFQAAGKTLKDLFKLLISQFGDGIKEYAIRFAKDEGLTAQLGAAPPKPQGVSVAAEVQRRLAAGQALTWQELFDLADKQFGGTQAEGKYTPKDAYDAVEAGVNRYLMDSGQFSPNATRERALEVVTQLQAMMALLPTQTKRTAEMDQYQQFSTVPPFAFVANWVANIQPGDVMMEPSAGIGGLAVFAKNAGAKLVLNELSSRRAEVLQSVFPEAKVFREDAEQIHNILPDSVKPTVVVMNPPFSSAAERGIKNTMVGAAHVEQALERLPEGGRLVAIVGEGMGLDRPAFKAWWAKMRDKHDVRAVVPVDGKGYAKYGTTFDNVLLVIDKVPSIGREPIVKPAANYGELIGLLAEVRDGRPAARTPVTDRPDAQPDRDQPPGDAGAGAGQGGDLASGAGAGPATGVGAGQPGDRPGLGGSRSGRGGSGRGGRSPGNVQQPGAGKTGAGADAAASGAGDALDGGGPDSTPQAAPSGVTITGAATAPAAALTDSVFEGYQPQRLQVEGAKPHPGPLVQSAAMASVLPPAATYVPNLPSATVTQGKLSIAQIESVVYAGQAHNQWVEINVTPDQQKRYGLAEGGNVKYRRGFFIGDGTGVGKGREISGILLDNLRQGRKKAVWVSEKQGLLNDAKRDFGGVGGDADLLFNQNETTADGKVPSKNGIIFTTYSTLRSGTAAAKPATAAQLAEKYPPGSEITLLVTPRDPDDPPVEFRVKMDSIEKRANKMWVLRGPYDQRVHVPLDKVVSINGDTNWAMAKTKAGAAQSRIDQLVDWLGPDFDGVIAFDEAHNAGNATAIKTDRGMTDPSAQALAVVDLQMRLPKARVVYVSATGATEVSNLSFANRLGLWGPGTPFSGVEHFVAEMTSGGLATMELVARDMKQSGMYLARSLSYDGVTYSRADHTLTDIQREMYDRMADGWQVVLKNMMAALELTGATKDGKSQKNNAKSAAKAAFWGGQQRFFNQVITSMQMPTVLDGMERDLQAGKAVVVQLVNTNEAQQERALAKRKEEGEEDLEDLDLTPMDQLIQLVTKSFPVQQYVTKKDSEGRTFSEPAVDSQGNPILNKAAVALRDKLLKDLEGIRDAVPDGPLEMLLNHFGPDVVAEVTGRKQRVVRKPDADGNVKATLESRGSSAARADAEAFMADRKRILVFSDAGGTGFSFQADLTKKNQRQRAHYLVQPGWRANKAVQGLGRTHRTNQASAPEYVLAATDIPAHKRFLSSIARRLDQLGALTKGQRDTSSGGLFSEKDNLESKYAVDGVKHLFADIERGQVEGIDTKDFLEQMGLEDIRNPETGQINESKVPGTAQFLNRLLSLRLSMQETVFNAFIVRMEEAVELAAKRGLLDTGMQTIRALETKVLSEEVVYVDERTGAETMLVDLEATQATRFYDPPDPVREGGKDGKGFRWMVNVKSGRVWGVARSGMTTKRDGSTEKRYRMMGTNGMSVRTESEFKPGAYKEISQEDALALWEKESAARPPTYTTRHNLIVGSMLPIWDRLKTNSTVQVKRTQTSDGRRLLGREIPTQEVAEIRKRLNLESAASKMTPVQVMEAVLRGEAGVLANGWRLTRSLVSGDLRIELTRGRAWDAGLISELKGYGLIHERIQWQERMFVPVGETGVEAMGKLLKAKPLTDIMAPEKKKGEDDDGQFARDADQRAYRLLQALQRNPMDAQRVRNLVAPIAKKWDVEVRVVDTPADLPVKAPADALGLHLNGVIYLVASTNRSPAQVHRTLAHEAVAHYGLRSMLGRDGFRAFVNQVQFAARARPGPLREVSDYIRRTYVDQDGVFNLTPAQEGDEIAARVVELGVDPISGEFKPGFGMLKAVFSKVAEFLRKLGIPVRFTNAELQGMLVRSMRRLQAGRPLTEAMTVQASMSRAPGFYFDAKSSPLYKQRTAQAAGAISEAQAREALATDAVARRIMAKGIEVQEGDRVGARLNINVLKNTGVAVNTIHRGKAGDGYTKNRGWWGGEVISYAPVVTLRDAYFNVDQKAREGIAAGAQAKSPMASVDGTFHKAHSFDGVEFRFNPKREHLFRDALGRVLKRADEVTITGNSAYARGEIEYYGPEDVPARAGDAPSQGRLLEPGNDDGDAAFARLGSAQTLSDVTEKLREAVEPIGTVSLWDKTVGTQFNKATKDRDFKRVFDAYLQQTDDTAHYAIEAERNAPDILMRLDNVVDAAKALWHSGPKHKRDLEAVSRALFANIEGREGVQSVRYDELSLRQIHGLNDRQIAMYYQARAAVDTSIERLAQTYAAQIGAANGLSIDELKNMALDDTVAMVKTHIQETHDGLRADEELRREVMAQDQDEALDRARQLGGFPAAPTVEETRMLLERLDKIEEKARFLQEAGYMPAMRFGEYAVTVTDPETNETLHFEMFESQTAANLAAMRLRREYPDGMIEKSVMNPEQYRMFKGVSPETVELFAQFTGADQSEAYQRYIALAKSARNVKMRELKRKGIAGFSENATRVLASFVTSNARQAAINMNVDEITAAMASKSLAAKGDVQREAQKLHEYMANPLEEARRLRGFMFLHFLGGSVASALVNLTQPMLQTAPYLSQYAGSRTSAIMARAARMAASGNYDNPTLRAAAERAAAEGITEPHEIHQLMADASGSSFGSNLQARAAVKLWGSLFSNAESFNRRITFIAAYQVALETGESDPYAFARRAVYETQGIYSKVNRPNWARGGVGATLFTFKQFTISYLEWWRRLPKREKVLAFAILVLFAGTEGLPFMDDIEDLIDTIGQTLGYNTNSKKAIRHAMVDTLGKTAGTMLNTGLLSMSGVDVSGRLGLGNLIPGTAMFKPSETDKTRTVSEFAGPLGGLVSQAQRAVAKVQQGNILGRTGALAEIAPSAVRNALQGLEMASTGVYRDTRGYKVSDVTVLESFGKMLGLQPESVASKTRRLSDEIQDKGMVTMMEAMIADRWAAGLAEKDPAKVQAARDALAAWNRNNPETPIRIKPMQITRRVREINRTREERFLRTAPKEMRGAAARELAS